MSSTIQYCFERYEKKYFLTPLQQTFLLEKMQPFIKADDYGKYSLGNIYYDTSDWRLIRASLENTGYKEKLRVRSYGVPEENGRVFVELKKKYAGVVYKRRITTDLSQVEPFLCGQMKDHCFGQIGREIEWFQHIYHTYPRVFIGYDRIAFAGIDDPMLRITFDTHMRWRNTDLDLSRGDDGNQLISSDAVLMEIKLPGVCPLWLSRLLSEIQAFPISFSKYGICYREHILENKRTEIEKTLKKEAHRCA